MTKYKSLDSVSYENKYGKITRKSFANDPNLTPMEIETSIIMTNTEEMAIVSSSQKPVMKYLILNNENFKIDDKGLAVKGGKIVGVNGTISKRCFRFTKHKRKLFGRL